MSLSAIILKEGVRGVWRRAARRVRGAARRRWLSALYAAVGRTGSPEARVQAALKPESKEQLKTGLGVRFPFWDAAGLPEAAELFKRRFPAAAETILRDAEGCLKGRYRILSAETLDLKKAGRELCAQRGMEPFYLPWHFDWASGHYWKMDKPFHGESWEESAGADPKRPWELSRMQHLVGLAQANLLTGEPRYLDEMAAQILAWRRENPYGLGVNWTVPMEAGIRLANILMALALAGNRIGPSHPRFQELNQALPCMVFDHVLFILNNLEWPNNHLVADLSCVLLACEMYPHFLAGDSWAKAAREAIVEEMRRQVYSDGMSFEASTAYHCFSLELFLAPWLTRPEIWPEAYETGLKKMFAAINTFIKPSGRIVSAGDNDSGRLFNFYPRASLERLDLVSLGFRLFNDTALIPPGFELEPVCGDLIWWMGPRAFQRQEERGEVPVVLTPSVSVLKEGGLASFRDPKAGHFICITLSKNGQNGAGGHAHNDRLSFELVCHGEEIFVDCGTGLYAGDPRLRDRLRSTSAHNTAALNEEEQNRFNGLFALREDVKNPQIECCSYDWKRGIFVFEGSHDGYLREPARVLHRRRLQWTLGPRMEILIVDSFIPFSGAGKEIPASWNFTLAPEMRLESVGGGAAALRAPSGRAYRLEASMPLEAGEALYSPEYGAALPTAAIRSRSLSRLPETFTFRLTETA